MPRGIEENFWTSEGAQGVNRGSKWGGGVHRVVSLESQREKITALNLLSTFAIFAQFGPSLAQI